MKNDERESFFQRLLKGRKRPKGTEGVPDTSFETHHPIKSFDELVGIDPSSSTSAVLADTPSQERVPVPTQPSSPRSKTPKATASKGTGDFDGIHRRIDGLYILVSNTARWVSESVPTSKHVLNATVLDCYFRFSITSFLSDLLGAPDPTDREAAFFSGKAKWVISRSRKELKESFSPNPSFNMDIENGYKGMVRACQEGRVDPSPVYEMLTDCFVAMMDIGGIFVEIVCLNQESSRKKLAQACFMMKNDLLWAYGAYTGSNAFLRAMEITCGGQPIEPYQVLNGYPSSAIRATREDIEWVRRMTGAVASKSRSKAIDAQLPDGRSLAVISFDGIWPSLGECPVDSDLDARDNIGDIASKLLKADVYAIVASDDQGKYFHLADVPAMEDYLIYEGFVFFSSSDGGRKGNVSWLSKPLRGGLDDLCGLIPAPERSIFKATTTSPDAAVLPVPTEAKAQTTSKPPQPKAIADFEARAEELTAPVKEPSPNDGKTWTGPGEVRTMRRETKLPKPSDPLRRPGILPGIARRLAWLDSSESNPVPIPLKRRCAGVGYLTADGRLVFEESHGYVIPDAWKSIARMAFDWRHLMTVRAVDDAIIGLRYDGSAMVCSVKDHDQYAVHPVHAAMDIAFTDSGVEFCPSFAADDLNQGAHADTAPFVVQICYDFSIKAYLLSDGTVRPSCREESLNSALRKWSHVVELYRCQEGFIGLKDDGTLLCAGVKPETRKMLSEWRGIRDISMGFDGTIVGLHEDGTLVSDSKDQGFLQRISYFGQVEELCGGLVRDAQGIVCGLRGNGVLGTMLDELSVPLYLQKIRETAERAACASGQLRHCNSRHALGLRHAVMARLDGSVWAGGGNEYGQCETEDWKDMVAVSAGSGFTVGLGRDGRPRAAGNNRYGQCEVEAWEGIAGITTGMNNTIGLYGNGTAVAAGRNDFGKNEIRSWTGLVDVCCGNYHTLGLREDGTVVAAGDNTWGQCDVVGWRDIVAIAAGGDHSVGLRKDGTVIATGANSEGQCATEAWIGVQAIAAFRDATVALRADSDLDMTGCLEHKPFAAYSWHGLQIVGGFGSRLFGIDDKGDFHVTGPDLDLEAWPESVEAKTWTTYQSPERNRRDRYRHELRSRYEGYLRPRIAETFKAIVFVLPSGALQVFPWSTNDTLEFSTSKDFVAVSAGPSFYAFLHDTGRVEVIGEDQDGLRSGTSTWQDVIAIATGDRHICALTKDGRVLSTGWNGFGQCDTQDWKDIRAIAASRDSTLGLCEDGTVRHAGKRYVTTDRLSRWRDIISIGSERDLFWGVRADGMQLSIEHLFESHNAPSFYDGPLHGLRCEVSESASCHPAREASDPAAGKLFSREPPFEISTARTNCYDFSLYSDGHLDYVVNRTYPDLPLQHAERKCLWLFKAAVIGP